MCFIVEKPLPNVVEVVASFELPWVTLDEIGHIAHIHSPFGFYTRMPTKIFRDHATWKHDLCEDG